MAAIKPRVGRQDRDDQAEDAGLRAAAPHPVADALGVEDGPLGEEFEEWHVMPLDGQLWLDALPFDATPITRRFFEALDRGDLSLFETQDGSLRAYGVRDGRRVLVHEFEAADFPPVGRRSDGES